MEKYEAYVQSVTSGEIVTGELMQKAVARFRSFLEDPELEFRPQAVTRVIDFISMLKHFKNKHAGKPFILEPWQCFICACVYGFYYKGTDRRVCQNVYIEIARKNGKTAFASALCLYHLVADGVAGAEVDMVANSRDQASIAFTFASTYADGLNTKKKKYFRTLRKDVFFDMNKSVMKVFASDASKLDGFDASMYLIDEYHAAPDTLLKDVLQSSQASRENPLEVIITTAGFDKTGPCYIYRTACVDVMSGLTEDKSLWAFIFSMDEGDDWTDEKNWIKVSPNLGVSVRPDFMEKQIIKAKNSPSEEVGIRTKTFNEWMDSSETWIPYKYITDSTYKFDLSEVYDRRECVVYGGIDLASNSDLTAFSTLVVKDGQFYYFTRFYLPEEALEVSPLKEIYKKWRAKGYLTVTPGNVTDYDYILADIKKVDAVMPFEVIGYDDWNASQFVISATNEGLPMHPYGQNIGNFNRPTKEQERLLLSGRAHLQNSPVVRFCYSNVVIRTDYNGNVKPDKSKSNNKIDGVIAELTALGCYLMDDHHEISL